jgi:hypothetical protein
MKIIQSILLTLFLTSFLLVGCASLNKDIISANSEFYYGKIKIYKIFDEKKMKFISEYCHFVNHDTITESALSVESKHYNLTYDPKYIGKGYNFAPKEKIDYLLKQGIFVFKKPHSKELTFDQIRCQIIHPGRINKELLTIRLPKLVVEANEEGGAVYFGNIEIFLPNIPSEIKKFRVVEHLGFSRNLSHKAIISYYDPIKIEISNNQEQTIKEVENSLEKTYFNHDKITYLPMKYIDSESGEKKNLQNSDKPIPF